jgi:DNA-binding MarR family transcriptional regulator
MPNTDKPHNESVFKLWLLWSEIFHLHMKLAEKVCSDSGISYPQFQILFLLKYSTHPMRIVDLANYIYQNANSVSMIVNRMVKQGLVRRIRSSRDRRIVIVKLTNHGTNLVEKTIPPFWQILNEEVSVFSDSEILRILVTLEKFNKHLFNEMTKGTYIKELEPIDVRKIADSIDVSHLK